MRTASKQNESRFARLGAFQHSRLDNHGLDVYQHRVYLHLLRRAGNDDTCYPSIASIASICLISDRKVLSVLKQLCEKGFIQRKKRYRENGSRSSDLITILGIPPGACGAPPLVHAMQYPGAPGAYKGNPMEGDPKNICSSDHQKSPTATSLILSGDPIRERYSPEIVAHAVAMAAEYYRHFNFADTAKAKTKCLECFAEFAESSANHVDTAKGFFDSLSQLTLSDRATEIQAHRSPPRNSTPWDLLKLLKSRKATFSNHAAVQSVVQSRLERFADSQRPAVMTPDPIGDNSRIVSSSPSTLEPNTHE